MLLVLGCRSQALAPSSRILSLLARPGGRLAQNTNRPWRPATAALTRVPAGLAPRALSTKPAARPSPTPSAPQPGGHQKPPQPPIPARLLIYHGSTARITFLACLRLGTLFICIFFCLAVAPAYLRDPGDDGALWKAGAAILSGIAPFIFVYFFTSPFVAFIHLSLPPFARQSKELLKRFAASVPETTSLEITTINLIGKPRITRVPVSALVPSSARFGIVNYVVRPGLGPSAPASAIRSLLSRPVTQFSIQHNSHRDAREAWVWESVTAAISRRASA